MTMSNQSISQIVVHGHTNYSKTVDFRDGTIHRFNLVRTLKIQFSPIPENSEHVRYSYVLQFVQDTIGGHGILWPDHIKWHMLDPIKGCVSKFQLQPLSSIIYQVYQSKNELLGEFQGWYEP